jgi:hypothetical protein
MKRFHAAVLFLVLALSSHAQTAAQLNTDGYKLFTQAKYWESADFFRKAVAKDKSYPYAWYNLACACSRILEQPDTYIPLMGETPCPPCDFGKFAVEGLAALEQAIKLNAEYAGKCQVDADLKRIRNELGFFRLLSYDFSRYNDVLTVMKSVKRWAMPGDGVYDPIVTIEFREDGTLAIFSGMYEKTKYWLYGSWHLVQQAKNLVIRITLEGNPYGLKSAVGIFKPDGTIAVDKGIWLDDWYQPGEHTYFSDYMNCCSA